LLRYAKFKFCPYCAKPGLAELKKNAMRCESCGFVYFHNCAAAAAGIIETAGGIILTRRAAEPKKGFYDLPGGFADYGETLEEALIREVREELGLKILNLSYLGSFPNEYAFRGVVYFTTDAVFTARCAGEPKIQEDREISDIGIFDPLDIDLEKIGFQSIKEALKKYILIKKS
jgi:NADH pyrophosphatase NudC (nudix superfamily)